MPFATSVLINYFTNLIVKLLAALPVLLIALPFHELAHGFTAYMLGDDTAKRMHRLTFNPFKHLDPLGSIGILLFGFGWAKPVPVNPYNFKHRKSDMAITALAGPLSNLVLAFLALLLLAVYEKLTGSMANDWAYSIVRYFAALNIGLAVFNLIPFPPLDGSRLLAVFLPENAFSSFERMRVFPILFIVILFSGFISGPINTVTSYIYTGFANFLNL